jgi:hypothetical protein
VDNKGAKVDPTMAYVGTRTLFERAGFTKAADTQSVSGGFQRVLMRLVLHAPGDLPPQGGYCSGTRRCNTTRC